MEFSHETNDKGVTVRGNLSEVQRRIEGVDQVLGQVTIGVAAAMISGRQQKVVFHLGDNDTVDNAPFELTVTHDEEGKPTRLEFEFLEEIPTNG